jgi:selenide, water dikinase
LRRLVLLGGGHSHVAVLKSQGEAPMQHLRLTLISAKRHALYSGMLPGLIAGHYDYLQCRIDLEHLAGYARAEFLEMEAVALDAGERLLLLADGRRIEYDVLSIDIGSTPPAFDIPGVPEQVIPAKPIEVLLPAWEELRARGAGLKRLALVGGGAAGVELVLAMQYRFRQDGAAPGFDLITDTPFVLPGHNVRARRLAQRVLDERGVRVHAGGKVVAVEPGRVVLEAGANIDADAVIWVTGAAPVPWLRASGLQTDAAGFVAVNACLQSESHAAVFAAGDCASVTGQPRPKSGVFAVRQGAPLDRNLRRALAGQALEPYASPPHALALISAGGKCAIATRNDWALQGAWVWLWKDWIDRRFVQTYERLSHT